MVDDEVGAAVDVVGAAEEVVFVAFATRPNSIGKMTSSAKIKDPAAGAYRSRRRAMASSFHSLPQSAHFRRGPLNSRDVGKRQNMAFSTPYTAMPLVTPSSTLTSLRFNNPLRKLPVCALGVAQIGRAHV